MGWYCVRIEDMSLTRAANLALQTTIIDSFREMGQPADCHVYRMGTDERGYSYFFTPGAAECFRGLIELWQGVSVSEPTNLLQMQRLI
jgi:hypothetical protein